jgi:hypothetical protein
MRLRDAWLENLAINLDRIAGSRDTPLVLSNYCDSRAELAE